MGGGQDVYLYSVKIGNFTKILMLSLKPLCMIAQQEKMQSLKLIFDLKMLLNFKIFFIFLFPGASTGGGGGSDDIIDRLFGDEIIVILLLWQLLITISLLVTCFCWYHRRQRKINKIDIAGRFHEIPAQNEEKDKVTIKTETEKMEAQINWVRSKHTMETTTSQDMVGVRKSHDRDNILNDGMTPVTSLELIPNKSLEIT